LVIILPVNVAEIIRSKSHGILFLYVSNVFVFMYGFSEPTLNLMFIGGFCFLISDLILAGSYFGHGKNKAHYVITNHLFYFGALALIAMSVYFI
jgi:hypothetical protein